MMESNATASVENLSPAPEKPKQSHRTVQNYIKLIGFSSLGILFFFIPFAGKTPMVWLINAIKGLLGVDVLRWLTLIVCTLLFVTLILAKVFHVKSLENYHKNDGPIKGTLYLLAIVFTVMVMFNIGPAAVLDPDVGVLAVDLAGSVLLTVSICGLMVIFVLHSGLVEFAGALLEPLMRPVFKLPGRAAVDCLASFVAAPAVGVYFTGQAYKMKIYTVREAFTVLTCWSVVSLGFFAVITSIAGIEEYYGQVVLCSLVLCFVMSAINVRIPPWSRKVNMFIDNTEQTPEQLKVSRPEGGRFNYAVAEGLGRVSEFDMKTFLLGAKDALSFTQKIVAYVASIATLGLILSEYTPLFTWIGYPMIPLLKLVGFGADAAIMAPATLVGISEIALPAILVSGGVVAAKSAFFICVLSTLQIIFFTESGNAMLECGIPLKIWDLLLVFLIRTLIAIPLVAAATHLFFM